MENLNDLLEAINEITMAREISKVDQDLIPVFDGDRITLKSYINACQFLIEEYLPAAPQNANDLRTAKRLLMIFMGRLRGKAREAVDANKTPTTWPELKNILIHSFGDKRSEEVLVYDLNSLTPRRDETTASYANKIKSTLYTLLSKINLEEENAAIRNMKQEQYNQIALRTYLFGLDLINNNIGLEVKLRRPRDIETAEGYALEITNYNTQKQRFLYNTRPTAAAPIRQPSRPHPVMSQNPAPVQRTQMTHPQQNPYQNRYIPPAMMLPRPMYHQQPQQQQNNQGFARNPAQVYQRPYRPTPMEVDGGNKRSASSSINRPAPKRQWMSNNMETFETVEDNYYVQYQDGEQIDEYTPIDQIYENDNGSVEDTTTEDFPQDTPQDPLT